MDKMIRDGRGETLITNDGATILQKIDVVHPTAKMVNRILFSSYKSPKHKILKQVMAQPLLWCSLEPYSKLLKVSLIKASIPTLFLKVIDHFD